MNDSLSQWLAGCALMPGVRGCGVRFPNCVCQSYSFNEDCSRELVDEMLNSLAETLTRFPHREPAPRWLTWTFSDGKLRLVIRPDGVLLGFASALDTPTEEQLNQISEEFLPMEIQTVEQ